MLLTGTHPRTLDDKHRLTLPKRVREELGTVDKLYVTPGQDRCLWMFVEANLESLAHKLDQAPATDGQARVFRRLFFAQMEAADLDKMGRLLVPDRLISFAELDKDVVLIGVRDHLELWDKARWNAYFAEHGPSFDAVAEAAFRK
jgi:MraZ protein